jgi:hypothetical protein
MAYFNAPNYCKVVLRPTHGTPTTIVLRESPSPHHSHHRFPAAGDVRSGTVYGPGQFEQQSYLTGTYTGSVGGAAFSVVGSPIIRRVGS